MMVLNTLNTARRTNGARKNVERAQRGITMVELGIVLLVGAIILGAVYYGLTSNLRRNSAQVNTSAITETAAELRKQFGITNRYANVTTAVAVSSNAIPGNLANSDGVTASNEFGGAITAAPATLTTANDAVTLTWGAVKTNVCMDIVNNAADVARRISVAGTIVLPLDTQPSLMDQDALSTACKSSNNVDIAFDIGR